MFVGIGVGLYQSSSVAALSGAASLLAGETDGLAFDFTDQTALIRDTGTPANNYNSTGVVSNGALVGPSGKLTYTSPSNKMTRQSDGYYKYQAHNLYLNSAAPANQAITVVSGASYSVTITGTVSVTASGAATGTWTAGTNTFTAATTTLTLGSTSGSGTVHVRRTPSNDDYIETAGAAKYALPLEYDTSGNCLGLLVEEQRTNLLTYSTDFANAAWVPSNDGTPGNPVVTSNSTVAPDGTTTADTLAVPAVSGSQYSYVAQTAACTAIANTLSVWLKGSAGGETVYLAITPDGVTYVSRSCTLTTEWQRFDVTGTLTNTTWYYLIGTDLRDGTQSATSAQTFYVWQAQIEIGAFVTSPILTYGAEATRLADNISIATSAFPYSSTEQSWFCEHTPIAPFNSDRVIGSNSANWTPLAMSSTTAIFTYVTASATKSSLSDMTGVATKMSSTYNSTSGVKITAQGAAPATNAGTTLTPITTVYVGSLLGSANTSDGHYTSICFVPRTKSSAEMQAETA